MEALSPLRVDSSHTLFEVMSGDPRIAGQVRDLLAQARLQDMFLSEDLSRLTMRYVLPLYGDGGIVGPFVHTRATAIHRLLGYVPSRAYTGVLVYAKGTLPAVGTSAEELFEPSLFPRIFDEQMNLVLDRLMCNPSDLAKWGMASCTTGLDENALTARIGLAPLRVAARAVFGTHATDLVISDEAVKQLLSSSENIALLQQGRIAIIYGEEK
jgi:hypothetical protein